MSAYDRLTTRFARIATVHEATSILNWDSEVIMPPGGGAARADQSAALATVAHGLLTDSAVGDDLAAAGTQSDPWHAANLRLMHRQYRRAVALPADLVEARTRADHLCEQAWRDARPRSDFAAVAPRLAEVVRLARETAQALAADLNMAPYDCLLDGWQPGVTEADITPVFTRYTAFLADALPAAEARQAAKASPTRPSGPFPADRQQRLCRLLAERIGLDFNAARLDISAHPFCGGTPTDIRITTRYNEADAAQALFGVVHETGHAMYEAGLPQAWARQPVGEAAGMAAHESQSLIVEMQAARSEAFLGWLAPLLHDAFGGDAAAWQPDNLTRLWRRVERSFIRVEADEMTYPAHVALRFDLERAMLAGDLPVADLPGAWNEGMRKRLSITPANDAEGCLQDIHWYAGIIGYFPSYTLGAMAAAQLMQTARAETPGLDAALGCGDFAPLMRWLREKVHSQGAVLGFNDLLRHATGRPLDAGAFEAHLTTRYLG